jgi:hypothetical protein
MPQALHSVLLDVGLGACAILPHRRRPILGSIGQGQSWSSCTPGDRPTGTRAALLADAGSRQHVQHDIRPTPSRPERPATWHRPTPAPVSQTWAIMSHMQPGEGDRAAGEPGSGEAWSQLDGAAEDAARAAVQEPFAFPRGYWLDGESTIGTIQVARVSMARDVSDVQAGTTR